MTIKDQRVRKEEEQRRRPRDKGRNVRDGTKQSGEGKGGNHPNTAVAWTANQRCLHCCDGEARRIIVNYHVIFLVVSLRSRLLTYSINL